MLILIFCGLIHVCNAQSNYDPAYDHLAGRFSEILVVYTDRSIYAVNETIRFSILLHSGTTASLEPGSKVVYVELMNSSGNKVAKAKYPITDNRSAGDLSIPSTIVTGNYYLRCYTRWMRNFGPHSFTYIPLRVVNPFSADVGATVPEPGKSQLEPVRAGSGAVSVVPASKSYRAGTIVEMEVFLKNGDINHVPQGCVTVVPEGAIDTSVFLHRVVPNPGNPPPVHLNFLPEIYGMAISGTVLKQDNQEPVPKTMIFLSLLDDDPAFLASQTDLQGRFLIKIPFRSGNQEMLVTPGNQPGHSVDVLVDNDFASDPLPFQPGPFILTQDEYLLASRLSRHMQLERVFLAPSGIDTAGLTNPVAPLPFFGIPEISVTLDEFVNLPNLEEVIENLVPKTFVKRKNGEMYFMIESGNPMIRLYPPLILIDHIPVFDMEDIMAIHPSKINRIEVVPEVYVTGEVKFGGIISITSRQSDFAGIELPEGSYFFDYTAFQPSKGPLQARYQGPGNIPDVRNTLYWADHLELHGDTPVKISFPAGSVPGSYLILYRGVSGDGDGVHGLSRFEIE